MEQKVIEGFHLSPQQKQLWLSGLKSPADRFQCAVRLEGPLQKAHLAAAFDQLVERHEILRTSFQHLPGMDVPLQVPSASRTTPLIREIDLGGLDHDTQRAKLEEQLRQELFLAFDYEQGELLHVCLISTAEQEHTLVITLSVLCADFWSVKNIIREISQLYASNSAEQLSEDVVQYADFSQWQNELLESEDGLEFRRKHQPSAPSIIKLPLEKEAEKGRSHPYESIALNISPELWSMVEALACEEGVPVSSVMLACWQTLLWRLTRQHDVSVATSFDGRKFKYLYDALGLFAKYLPLRTEFEADFQFREVLKEVHHSLTAISARQELYDEELFSGEDRATAQASSPIGFEYEEWPAGQHACDLSFTVDKLYGSIAQCKLRLSCFQEQQSYRAELQYDSSRYESRAISRLCEEFITLLGSAVTSPGKVISLLNLLGDSERQLLAQWNETAQPYPSLSCLHHLFEQQVARSPLAPALLFHDQLLSFDDLNRRANRLAHLLLRRGLAPDQVVALCLPRSPLLLVSLLGVLKAGAAYLPVEADTAPERLTLMMEDSGACLLLTEKQSWSELFEESAAPSVPVLFLDEVEELLASESEENPQSRVRAENLAYVIYTSGSTGRPKGVMVAHQSVSNLHTATASASSPTRCAATLAPCSTISISTA
jgi:hypothetical protein